MFILVIQVQTDCTFNFCQHLSVICVLIMTPAPCSLQFFAVPFRAVLSDCNLTHFQFWRTV